MQGPIQAAYKETFQSIVLPVFERGCQSMFQQINDSFKQGTNECKNYRSRLHYPYDFLFVLVYGNKKLSGAYEWIWQVVECS